MTTNMFPLVSVIVTCFNHENYIAECINSIVLQTYTNIELIVIDDGSKDRSLEIIQALGKEHGFYFEHQENQGVCAALNKGIQLAKGEYICACDSDDKFDITKIAKQVEFMQKNPQYGCCYTNKIFFDNDNNEKIENAGKRRSGWLFEPLIMGEFSIPFSSHMLHRNVYDEVGLYDQSLKIQDWDMFLRIAKRFEIGFLNEDLLYYRLHNMNAHSNVNLMLDAKYNVLAKWRNDPIYKKACQHWDIQYFNDFAKIDKPRALKMLLKVLTYKDLRILKGFRRLLLKW